MGRAGALIAILVAAATPAGASSSTGADPPILVPWKQVGHVELGSPRARVQKEYGGAGHGYHVVQRYGKTVVGYYRLHGTKVNVTFYGSRVGEIAFTTSFYRTSSGFGVGSKIPLGPCHRTMKEPCEHRWHGFVFNAWSKDKPCLCWVKVGTGKRSLAATAANFQKPWFFIYTRAGRATRFYFALRFID